MKSKIINSNIRLNINDIYKIYIKANKIYSCLLWDGHEDNEANSVSRNAKKLLITHSLYALEIKTLVEEVQKNNFTNLDKLMLNICRTIKWTTQVIDEYNITHPSNKVTNITIPALNVEISELLLNHNNSWSFYNKTSQGDNDTHKINNNDVVVTISKDESIVFDLKEFMLLNVKKMAIATKNVFACLDISVDYWNELTIKAACYNEDSEYTYCTVDDAKIARVFKTNK